MFRLIHFKDPFKDIETGLDGRDEELCKPLLQLFYTLGASKELQKEMETALQYFLNIKNNRKENSKEAQIYPIITNCVSLNGKEIPCGKLWEIISMSLDGKTDEKNPNLFLSPDFGKLYRSTTIKMICDKFGGEMKHERDGNVLIFDVDYLAKMGKIYTKVNGIQTKLVVDKNESKINKCDSCDSGDAPLGREPDSNVPVTVEIQAQNAPKNNIVNTNSLPQNESHESRESPKEIKEVVITKKKCPTCDYTCEPFFMKVHQCPKKVNQIDLTQRKASK